MKKRNKKNTPKKSWSEQNKPIKPKSPQKKPLKEGRYLMGRRTLAQILTHNPERVLNIYVSKSVIKTSPFDNLLLKLQHKFDICYTQMFNDELTELVGSSSHQGIVAKVSDLKTLSLKEFISQESAEDSKPKTLLALDGVLDPHNLGTILRVAECHGVDGVIFSRNRIAPFTPVVSKAAVGALDEITLIEVGNLKDSIERLKSQDYWIVGMMDRAETELPNFEFPQKTIIVLGSEGSGVSKGIQQKSDFVVKIPMYGNISSLNVSQAASIVLYARKIS